VNNKIERTTCNYLLLLKNSTIYNEGCTPCGKVDGAVAAIAFATPADVVLTGFHDGNICPYLK
jgi:hypothetical protein